MTAPKVEQATKKGMIQAMLPNNLFANVCENKVKSERRNVTATMAVVSWQGNPDGATHNHHMTNSAKLVSQILWFFLMKRDKQTQYTTGDHDKATVLIDRKFWLIQLNTTQPRVL